jgi:uncharacterized RDD family membrane protein YckC
VTKTCLLCGAVLPSSARACDFCEISPRALAVAQPTTAGAHFSADISDRGQDQAWRAELAQRLETYRGRKRKAAPNNVAQPCLPFEESAGAPLPAPKQKTCAAGGAARAAAPVARSLAAMDVAPPAREDFSFTIAIGRPPRKREDDTRMVIDVSLPPEPSAEAASESASHIALDRYGLYPVATIEERRLAAVIDAACLLFVLGAFLALFGAIGGDFTASKLGGAVCFLTLAIVYLQYFALFTIFGGTTPGMMLRGLQVVSFSGEPPSPRQMLLRSAGSMLSAGTFFLGFLWSMWDEDTLTWHDRMSRTYLHSTALSEVDAARAAPIH